MIAGCYVLDLYCDREEESAKNGGVHDYDEFPHQYTGQTGGNCRKKARQDGWVIKWHLRAAICPKCARKAKTLPR